MQVGYARVSTADQHLEVQLAKLQQAGCEKIFQEKRSGRQGVRVELVRCLDYVRDEHDTLVITRLDRLARSMVDLCAIVATLQAKHVQLVVLDQAIDTTRPEGRLTFHLLSAIAEFETDLRRERQMEGIAHAKANSVHFGRKHALTAPQVAALRQRRAEGVLIKVLMQEYRLSKAAIYRYLTPAQPQAEASP